jgi:NTE family protein
MKHAACCLLLLVLAVPVTPAVAQPAAAAEPRPRVGLVLSGGGARGLAHVGVLKVLEEARVPVDVIAGTSMGAVVGGLYASGRSAAEIETLLRTVDWRAGFQDRPPRQDLDFRRKQEEREFLVRLPVGFDRRGLKLPRGLVQGQKLTQILRRETLRVAEVTDFDRLPIPFRAIATDIETGEVVVLAGGDLTSALRASVSAPGVFAPVELDGRLLVDGGLVDNLPVDVVQALGVDVVIAVDVGYQPQARDTLDSALAVSNQMIAVMMRRETERQRARLGERDILVEPDLGSLGSLEFQRAELMMDRGEEAARALLPRLAALSMQAPAWQRLVEQRRGAAIEPPVVAFVRADATSQRHAPLIEAALAPAIGKPLDARAAARGVARLYGDGHFDTVDYRLVRIGDATGIEVAARPRSWGPNFLRFGLELQDDLEGGSSFNAGVRLLFTDINRFGGEFQTDLKVGQEPRLFAELYQPLAPASRWFVAPRFDLSRRNFEVIEGDLRLAEYRLREYELGFDLGREYGNWGEARIGVLGGSGSSELRIGARDGELPERIAFERGALSAGFALDRVDSAYFPRHGETFSIGWLGSRGWLGADNDSDLVELDWLLARSRGRSSLVLWLTGGSDVGSERSAVQDYYTLGGLFNLSGRVADSLAGPHFAVARAIYYRRIGRGGDGFLNVPTYVGTSLELGNVWQRRGDMSLESARVNGSLFLGLDTPIGPVYLATGFEEGGGNAFYLLLGRIR